LGTNGTLLRISHSPVVLNRGIHLTTGRQSFPGGWQPLRALQHGTFLNGKVFRPNITSVPVLRRYVVVGLAPAAMEVGLKVP